MGRSSSAVVYDSWMTPEHWRKRDCLKNMTLINLRDTLSLLWWTIWPSINGRVLTNRVVIISTDCKSRKGFVWSSVSANFVEIFQSNNIKSVLNIVDVSWYYKNYHWLFTVLWSWSCCMHVFCLFNLLITAVCHVWPHLSQNVL